MIFRALCKFAVPLLLFSNNVFAGSLSVVEDVVDANDVRASTSEYPIKICVGELGQGNNRGVVSKQNSDGYNYLKINTYKAKSGDILKLRKQKYLFSNKTGSFSYDFGANNNTAFRVGSAQYGGLSIEPSRYCEKK